MLASTEIRAAAIAHGRAIKRANALTAILCGSLSATALCTFFPTSFPKWLIGIGVGLLWASGFEYVYHRFLLHWPGTPLARGHLEHHATVGTLTEAGHVNLASSPAGVVAMFVVNGVPVVTADVLFRLGMAPGMLLAFAVYFITAEEIHWRTHVGGWLPQMLQASKVHHLAHHVRPDARFNIFLPIWDIVLGSMGK